MDELEGKSTTMLNRGQFQVEESDVMDYDPSDWQDEDRQKGNKKKNKKRRANKSGYFDEEDSE